jgi:hypothetical protein
MGQVPDDELRWVRRCGDDDLVALASQKGMVIVNSCNKVVLFYVLGTHAIFCYYSRTISYFIFMFVLFHLASYPWKENKRYCCNEDKGR